MPRGEAWPVDLRQSSQSREQSAKRAGGTRTFAIAYFLVFLLYLFRKTFVLTLSRSMIVLFLSKNHAFIVKSGRDTKL